MRLLITDEMIDAAVEYLNEQGDAAAQAYADVHIAEFRRKSERARLILRSIEKTDAMRSAFAESHPDYEKAYRAEAEAIKALQWHKHQMSRAEGIRAAWQTQSSNFRDLGKIR